MSETSAAPASAVTNEAAPQNTTESVESNEGSSEQVANLQEQAVNGTPAQKQEAKKTLKQLKIKYNGKESLEDLPFEIPDDDSARDFMTKHLQLSKMSASKAQEYSQLEKEIRHFVEELRKNPRKVLSDPSVGVDLKKIATELIEEEISNSQKSPEQIEKEKLELELKSIREEREREKEEMQAREFERLQEQAYERYDTQMTKALEGSDLPKSPYVIKKMADYMMMAIQNNIDASPEDVLPLVREEILNDVKSMFSVMPEDVIEGIVGKETINKIRKKNLAKAKTPPPTPVNSAIKDTGSKSAPKVDASQKKSIREFFGV